MERISTEGGRGETALPACQTSYARAQGATSLFFATSQTPQRGYFLIETRQHCEQRAFDDLTDSGLKPYLPRVAPQGVASKTGLLLNGASLFLPRHLLLLDEGFGFDAALLSTSVRDVVRHGVLPLIVPEFVVGAMRARERDGLIYYDSRVQQLIAVTSLDRLFRPMRSGVRADLFPLVVKSLQPVECAA